MEFSDVDLGHKEEPEEVGVVFEQDAAISVVSKFEGGGCQAGVEFKSHGLSYH